MVFYELMRDVCDLLSVSTANLNTDTVLLRLQMADKLYYFEWVDSVNSICVSSSLGQQPEDDHNRQALFIALLAHQRYGVMTKNGYFALDQEENKVLFSRNIDVTNETPESIVNKLNDYFIAFDYWRETYKSNDLITDQSDNDTPTAEFSGGRSNIIYA